MQKEIVFSILSFVSFLSVSCSKDSNGKGNTTQHSTIELILNADNGRSVDFEDETVTYYMRKPVVESTLPALIFDNAVSLEDFDKVVLSAGSGKFQCIQIISADVQNMNGEGQRVSLCFRLNYEELNQLIKYRETPGTKVKLFFNDKLMDEKPLKGREITNDVSIDLLGDTLIIHNVKEIFDKTDDYTCNVTGSNTTYTLGFSATMDPPMGAPGFTVEDGTTTLIIPLGEYEKNCMFVLYYGEETRVMYKQETDIKEVI